MAHSTEKARRGKWTALGKWEQTHLSSVYGPLKERGNNFFLTFITGVCEGVALCAVAFAAYRLRVSIWQATYPIH